MTAPREEPWWAWPLRVRLDELEADADERRREAATAAGAPLPFTTSAAYAEFIESLVAAAERLARAVERTGPH